MVCTTTGDIANILAGCGAFIYVVWTAMTCSSFENISKYLNFSIILKLYSPKSIRT
jgi:hypothetical protein